MRNKIFSFIQWLMIILGAFLIIDGFVFIFLSNFTIGTIMVLVAGALFCAIGIWFKDVYRITNHGIMRVLKYIVCVGVAFTIGLCGFIAVYGNIDTSSGKEDIIMVLGCAVNGTEPTQPLVERLETAIKAYNKNNSAYILVSGGQGPQEDISEADAMADYLISRGVDSSNIIKEDRSTSTSENYKYSKEILDSRFSNYTITIITNDFHIYRAKQLAKLADLEVTSIHAKTPFTSAPMMYLREVLAILKLWILRY